MDPWVKNPQAAKNPGPFREGDRVSFPYGSGSVVGKIIEDRGNIGYRGRRLYRVQVPQQDVPEDFETEVPAEYMTLVEKAPEPPKRRRK